MNQNNSLDNLLEQGHHQLERGQYEAGLEVFQQADSLFPNNAQAKYGLGLAHYRLEQYRECIDCLNLALQIRAVYPLALVRRGLVYKALKQSDRANADFEAVLQIEPQTHEDWRARGIAFDELKQSESALDCYNKALEVEPNDHQSWHNKGLALQNLQSFKKALASFDKAIKILPDKFFSIRSRGNILIFIQRYQEAIASYDRALKLKPYDTWRGLSLVSLGEYQSAIENCDAALKIKPDDFFSWWCRGNALSSLNQHEEALACYEKALEINPDFTIAREKRDNLLSSIKINFLLEIIRAIDSGDGKEQVYSLLEKNIHLVNDDLAKTLQIWTSNLEPEQKQAIGHVIRNFSFFIQQFPLGNRSSNLEIATTGYNLFLTIYTETDFSVDWAATQSNLGNVYYERIKGDRADNIERAIASYERALIIYTQQDFPVYWAIIQNDLGDAYRNRIKGDRADNIETAIESYEQALIIRTQQDFPVDWAATQSNLGNTYCDRIKEDKADNIETAIESYEQALIIHTQQDSPVDWAMTHNNLGNAYCRRIKGDKADNLETAIESYERALIIYTQQDSPVDWATTNNNLGNAYCYRIEGDRADNLESAIFSYERALIIRTQQDFPIDWATTNNNLGTVYRDRIEGDRADNLERAITFFKRALIIRTQQDFPINWAIIQNNLGTAYCDRIKGDRGKNKNLAIECFQAALKIYTPKAEPIKCLSVNRHLGNLALSQKQWQLAIGAYSQAIEAVEISRQAASSEARKQEILSDAISVYVNMARACIQDEQYTKAIEYLERSKTRNLVDLLANSQLHPRGVSQSILDSLDALRRNIIAAERRLQQQNTEECFNRLSSLRQSMEYLLRTHIQPVDPGFQLSERVEPISFAQIQAALPTTQTAAIEWCVSKDTLAAFIVTKDRAKPLVITSDFEEVQTLIDIKDRYLSKYREYKEKWQERLILFLYQLAQTLEWDKIVKSLIQILPDCNKVILVPHRWLHIIPIHALPLKDGSCLLDCFPQGVSYAPSVQLFELTQQLSHPTLKNFFAVQNPTQDLQFTDIEVESIGSQFKPHDDIIKHKAAHRKALTKDRLSNANCTHFSCHGQFNFEKPELSALLLAESKVERGQENGKKEETRFLPSRDGGSIDLDKCLTLGEIFTLDLRNCRLVTLSACETGLTDINNLSDEYIGLPSGFLYAGSPSVVSSLWAVNDISTSFLMIKFYQNLRSIDSVPIALNQAQLWLRSVTKEELEQWKDTLDIPGAQMFEIDGALRRMPDNSYPFASPYHWAAFCAVGS